MSLVASHRTVVSEAPASARDAGTPADESTQRGEIKPLTSLRFVAAMLVFLSHAPLTQSLADRFALGQAGVGFFFLLSGFILTWSYHRAFAQRLTWQAARNFYIARFARIYPMLLVTTAIAAIVLGWGEGIRYGDGPLWFGTDPAHRIHVLIVELTMTKAWFADAALALGVNPPSWSIADEAFFYAVFPAIACYLLRALRYFGSGTPIALAALVWAVTVVSFNGLSHAWFLSYFPPVRLVDFTVGILTAIAVLKGARLPSSFEYIAILATGATIAAMPLLPQSLRFSLALMPCWVLLIVTFAAQRGIISQVLSLPSFVRLGEVSFAFYLIHHTAIEAIPSRFGTTAFAAAASLAISLASAFVLFMIVEAPCRRAILGRRRNDRRRGPQQTAVAHGSTVAGDRVPAEL